MISVIIRHANNGHPCGLPVSAMESSSGRQEEAKTIAEAAGFHGGFVVHIGCGDGSLTAALRRWFVTGDPEDVSPTLLEPARSALKSSLLDLRACGPSIPEPDDPKNDY